MHPQINDCPGLAWRPRADAWIALWIARRDLVQRGYRPKTARLGVFAGELTDADVKMLRSECARLQDQMLAWARGGTIAGLELDGTVRGLIECYRRDPDSPYQRVRFMSRRLYDIHLSAIEESVGERSLGVLSGRDFMRWFEIWRGDGHVARAHGRMTMIRMMLTFGTAILEDRNCRRLKEILGDLKFQSPRARSVVLTAAQATAIRRRAHERGWHSMALAQAFQFELMLRPKDVIGEWLPMSEPGLSTVTAHGRKWMFGLDWREITPDLILRHRLSKSLRGRDAAADPRAGKWMEFDLKLYPMVMAELDGVAMADRVGPLIVDERTGLPYSPQPYSSRWRIIADAAGVPPTVQNRDSRAGGITEGIFASGGDIEAVRQAAGHKSTNMTRIYSRAEDEQTAKVAVLRAHKRSKNDDDK